jgi:hypothetical protein
VPVGRFCLPGTRPEDLAGWEVKPILVWPGDVWIGRTVRRILVSHRMK